MIIPNFKCYQDEKYIYVEIKALNSRIEKAEFDLNDNTIIFSCTPYFLRIILPNKIKPSEEDECTWDSTNNHFILKVKKFYENEFFEDLDMISKLLVGTKEEDLKKKKLIEVIDNEVTENISEDDSLEFDQNFLINLQFEVFKNESFTIVDSKYKYGFLNRYSNIIEKYQDELWQFADLKNPYDLDLNLRKEEKQKQELNDFDQEYYLSDTYDNSEENFCDNISKCFYSSEDKFTDDEIFRLKNLAKKEIMLSKEEKIILLYGLIDILFAFCYDKRLNNGESCCESAWNISKLSSTFSWFDSFWNIEDVTSSCIRRSLIYPLFRNFDFSKKILKDVIEVLKFGKTTIIKCLLETQKIFNEYGNFKYLLNDLYINDYIIAIQYLDKKYFERLHDLLESNSSVTKASLNLDIDLLEKAAELIIEEDKINELSNKLKNTVTV